MQIRRLLRSFWVRRPRFVPRFQLYLLFLALSLVATLALVATGPVVAAQTGKPGSHIPVERQSVVNFTDLAQKSAQTQNVPSVKPAPRHRPVAPNVLPDDLKATTAQSPSSLDTATPPSPRSPSLSTSFQALDDNGTSIPPDTHGTVGPNHVMTTLNTEVRIQTRTGTTLSTVSLDNFWTSVTGGGSTFDPKVLYDPYSKRWLFTACVDGFAASSGVLIATSQSDDPTGNWNLYKVDADASNVDWADYPSIGFNKDWVVVDVNMFGISSGSFTGGHVYVFDKAKLYAGLANTPTLLTDANGFTMVPAITYDQNLSTLYLINDYGYSATTNYLRLSKITGAVGSETLTSLVSYVGESNITWTYGAAGGADFAPQLGSANKIDAGDSRIQDVVYRNGSLWTTHTVFLPNSGPTRSAVQWWQMSTSGTVLQRSRIEDVSGVNFYAYPTIAVNRSNEAMIGFSRFSSTQYASANYTFRTSTDVTNTMQSEAVLKAGEASYYKTYGGPNNRWGDYSNTSVDPLNDSNFWTIQEYAATPSGGSRWGTWWGQVIRKADPTNTLTSSLNPSTVGQNVTFTATLDPGSTASLSPTGNVTFKDGTTTLGSGTVSAAGVATFSTTSLSQSVHSITAVYEGDTNFNTLTSATLSQTVNAVPPASTTTTVSSSLNPSTFGQSVTFTAQVSSLGGTPTGTVTFKDGATTIGSGTLNGSGLATFSTTTLAVASHSITAVYDGNTSFATSTSSVLSQVVSKADTTTGLTSSTATPSSGQNVTFTATVSPVAPGAGTPTGTVTFKDGATTIGSGTLNGSGVATFSTTSLAIGSHSITAEYGNDANFNGSTSSTVTVVVADSCDQLLVNKGSDTLDCGTLRSAIIYANSKIGTQDVQITITGVSEITLTSALPVLINPGTHDLHVEGSCTSDGGFPRSKPATKLTRSGLFAGPGLSLTNKTSVTGLAINGFEGYGIEANGNDNAFYCNWIGTMDGLMAAPNGGGLQITGNNNQIGNNAQSAYNLISGNTGLGIGIVSGSGNTSAGTWVGLAKDGLATLKNGGGALRVEKGGQLKLFTGNRMRS